MDFNNFSVVIGHSPYEIRVFSMIFFSAKQDDLRGKKRTVLSKLFGKSQNFQCVQRVFAQTYAITWQEKHICPILEIGLGPPTAETKSLKNYANFDLGDLVLRSPALWSS